MATVVESRCDVLVVADMAVALVFVGDLARQDKIAVLLAISEAALVDVASGRGFGELATALRSAFLEFAFVDVARESVYELAITRVLAASEFAQILVTVGRDEMTAAVECTLVVERAFIVGLAEPVFRAGG